MLYETVNTGCIDVESLPWVPFTPYSPDVLLKYIKLDPVRGEMVVLLKAPGDMQMPRHHHSGTVIVYTITGKWKYAEHDWVATPGSVVYETASTEHTPVALAEGGEVLALNIIVGELIYLDADNKVIAIENWKTAMERYLAHCKAHGITPQDLTAFNG
ncbi:MAG: 2,4'-dihydroxyacetophenone dioxygenase family protein [Pseudomonadota bacterium]|nr:2,4'-dihydroxyacetophenone dioxygenase family protein [Pseudomonadota bacterium]